jgi:hypothetical protein
MDAVLRTSRVSGMTLSDLLSDLADVLGDEVLLRLLYCSLTLFPCLDMH